MSNVYLRALLVILSVVIQRKFVLLCFVFVGCCFFVVVFRIWVPRGAAMSACSLPMKSCNRLVRDVLGTFGHTMPSLPMTSLTQTAWLGLCFATFKRHI